MSVQPFKVDIDQKTLDDLYERLARTRWTDEVSGADWNYGTNLSYLQQLVRYWHNDFDWRKQEKALNAFSHFRANVAGLNIHFIHERGKGSDPLPLVLLHGWPSSFWQMTKIIPMLTDPERFGGGSGDSFDVIVPSLPGYGFSDRPIRPGMSVGRIADLFATLMTTELGYSRFAMRGSDLGAGVIQQFALTRPELLIGIHVSGTNPYVGQVPGDLTEDERTFIENAQRWTQQEMAYAMEHSSKPQTLASGLNDSPVGLASWLVEKFRTWSDCEGDLERRFTKDELLTNLTIYWATETINSSIRLYYETARDPGRWGRIEVPTGMLMTPRDLFPTPRTWAERTYKVSRWTDIAHGGHFLEWEEPEAVAEDICTFFHSLRKA